MPSAAKPSNRFYVGFEITDACNKQCRHCLREVPPRPHHLSYSLFLSLLRQLQAYQRPHLALTGGEPTLHPRFADMVRAMAAGGFTFHLVTNGSRIARTLQLVEPAGRQFVGLSVSLDGANPSTHDAIRGPGSYREVMSTIAACRVRGIDVSCQMVVHRRNRGEVRPLAALCSELGVSKLHLSHMQPTPENLQQGWILSPQEWLALEEEVEQVSGVYQVPIYMAAGYSDRSPISNCHFLSLACLNINCRGQLTLCCQISGTSGGNNGRDIIADLRRVPLAEAHRRYLDRVAALSKYKIELLGRGALGPLDRFPCWFCQKYFDKVAWMAAYPENEWVRQDRAYFAHAQPPARRRRSPRRSSPPN